MLRQDAATSPPGIRPRVRHAEQMLAAGMDSRDHDQFVLVALQYQSILADHAFAATDPYRSEIQSGLGAVLCLIAQGEPPGPRSLDYLARAQAMLHKALATLQSSTDPIAWATTRANLAIVLLTRYEQTHISGDLLAALMALDGVAETFARAGDAEAEAWARSISRQSDTLTHAPN